MTQQARHLRNIKVNSEVAKVQSVRLGDVLTTQDLDQTFFGPVFPRIKKGN